MRNYNKKAGRILDGNTRKLETIRNGKGKKKDLQGFNGDLCVEPLYLKAENKKLTF
jgi:hypothetical protein